MWCNTQQYSNCDGRRQYMLAGLPMSSVEVYPVHKHYGHRLICFWAGVCLSSEVMVAGGRAMATGKCQACCLRL